MLSMIVHVGAHSRGAILVVSQWEGPLTRRHYTEVSLLPFSEQVRGGN